MGEFASFFLALEYRTDRFGAKKHQADPRFVTEINCPLYSPNTEGCQYILIG